MNLAATAVGAGAGFASGLVLGFVASVVVLAARRMRNARLLRKGMAPYRDLVLPPFHVFGAVVGIVAGAIAGSVWDWRAAAISGAVLPVLLLLVGSAIALSQSSGGPSR